MVKAKDHLVDIKIEVYIKMHRKDLYKKGYKSKGKEITMLKAQTLGNKLKKQGKIKTFIVSKCNNGMWEVYGK